jgi:hypothetical protein
MVSHPLARLLPTLNRDALSMHIKQTVEAFGQPYIEYDYRDDVIPDLVRIEFSPTIHPSDNYGVSEPAFTFCEEVAIAEQLSHCVANNIDFGDGLDTFRICALELYEHRSRNGVLTERPRWLYGIRYFRGTRELTWFEEDELVRPIHPSEEPF